MVSSTSSRCVSARRRRKCELCMVKGATLRVQAGAHAHFDFEASPCEQTYDLSFGSCFAFLPKMTALCKRVRQFQPAQTSYLKQGNAQSVLDDLAEDRRTALEVVQEDVVYEPVAG